MGYSNGLLNHSTFSLSKADFLCLRPPVPALTSIYGVGCCHHCPKDGVGCGLPRAVGSGSWYSSRQWYKRALGLTLPILVSRREAHNQCCEAKPYTPEDDQSAIAAHHCTGESCKDRSRDDVANTRLNNCCCTAYKKSVYTLYVIVTEITYRRRFQLIQSLRLRELLPCIQAQREGPQSAQSSTDVALSNP
jgi:hypothetical protein